MCCIYEAQLPDGPDADFPLIVRLEVADCLATRIRPTGLKAPAQTGLTQAEFAAHRGVSRRVIQDIERGTGNPTVESLNSIAKLFGLRVGLVPIRKKELGEPTSG